MWYLFFVSTGLTFFGLMRYTFPNIIYFQNDSKKGDWNYKANNVSLILTLKVNL